MKKYNYNKVKEIALNKENQKHIGYQSSFYDRHDRFVDIIIEDLYKATTFKANSDNVPHDKWFYEKDKYSDMLLEMFKGAEEK